MRSLQLAALVYLSFLMLVCISCQEEEQPKDTFSHIADWGKEAALSQVESICFDSGNDLYYVSNGKAYKPENEGYISRFSAAGDVLEARWIDSLHRPTGMAVSGNTLYVADVNRLLAIDTELGEIMHSYSSPIPNPGVNDVAISDAGEIYVSASFQHAVMKLQGNRLRLWMQDEKLLEYANGLYCTNGKLWVAGMNLTAIDMESQRAQEVKLPEGIQDFDGIYVGPKEELLLSTVENSSLWYLNSSGAAQKLLEGKDYYLGDFHYHPNKKLLIPRGSHEKAEYFISSFHFPQKE
ncbi:MAG: hypothetical protein AAGD28_27090 [Bacteroidota bacterium]